ncbi:smg-9 nonsense mediated mRNA decay factor [Biomphalaria glabrata]|nr:hypothetical protein BgiMline_013502 [Biomphalaria glabrata]
MNMNIMIKKEDQKDSCQNICGKWQVIPCSCDPRCLVFGNCCEDFEVECSGMAEESKSKYAGLLHSEVKCIDNIFVITSCSVADTRSQNFTSLDRIKNLDAQTKQGANFFTDFLLNEIPVLDVSTGLSFINKAVFNCNGGNASNALNWDITVSKLEISFDFPPKLLLEDLTNKENYIFYVLPFQYKTKEAGNECKSINSSSCSKTEHPLYSKCKSFISYVIHVDEHPIIFNNKYCAQCNGFTNVSSLNSPGKTYTHNSNFDVLISMSEAKVNVVKTYDRKGIHWSSIACNTSGNLEYKHSLECNVICVTGLVLRLNKQCKKPLSLQIAISTNIILPGKTDVKIWTDYVHCFLTQVLELDIETVLNYSKVNRFYDIEESFYWMKMLAYGTKSILETQVKMFRNLFYLLADSLAKMNATTNSKNSIFNLNSSLESIKMCGLVVDTMEQEFSPQETDNGLFCRDIFLETGDDNIQKQNSCLLQFSRCSSTHFVPFYFPIQLSGLLIASFFIYSSSIFS